MARTDSASQTPWHDVQMEPAAQLSALSLQIAAGRYPWQDAADARRAPPPALPAQRVAQVAAPYQLLIV